MNRVFAKPNRFHTILMKLCMIQRRKRKKRKREHNTSCTRGRMILYKNSILVVVVVTFLSQRVHLYHIENAVCCRAGVFVSIKCKENLQFCKMLFLFLALKTYKTLNDGTTLQQGTHNNLRYAPTPRSHKNTHTHIKNHFSCVAVSVGLGIIIAFAFFFLHFFFIRYRSTLIPQLGNCIRICLISMFHFCFSLFLFLSFIFTNNLFYE